MDYSEKHCCVGLSFFEGIGPVRFRALYQVFGSARGIYRASVDDLARTGIGDSLVQRFCSFRESFDLTSFVDSFEKKGIVAIPHDDPRYPKTLTQLEGAPFILFGWGDIALLEHDHMLAIVGTRMPTTYGVQVTRMFSEGLSRHGFLIVSGMAMGIDAIAHRAALDAGRSTIAVLGCGVDICYPAVNRQLYQDIISRGLIISEFPPGSKTSKGVFPSRNRIVAGLSRGVLVTEGARHSGSIITATYASEYGKDVFAVPGPVTSDMSGATTYLLQEGAKAVASVDDILTEYNVAKKGAMPDKQMFDALLSTLTDHERTVVTSVKNGGTLHIDEISRHVELPVSEVMTIVSTLEMKGVLREIGHEEYQLSTNM